MPDEYDLRELSHHAGVTPRTVHFYIQQGLLPPAGATGPGARYTDAHLLRLRLIRLLQKEHLPLAEIGRRIKTLDDRHVARLLRERRGRVESASGSALEYVRGVLSKRAPARVEEHSSWPMVTAPDAEPPGRSQWDRFAIADGLELHVRRPGTRDQQRRLERLLAAARDTFSEPL